MVETRGKVLATSGYTDYGQSLWKPGPKKFLPSPANPSFCDNNLETFENNDESNNSKLNKNTEKIDTSGPNWRGETDPDNALIPYKYMKKNSITTTLN